MKIKYLVFASLTIFFWGISLIATKSLLLNGFTPNIITFLRFLIASVIMILFMGKKLFINIQKEDWKYLILMGLGGVSLFYYFENAGLQYTTVGNTSLITATIPMFTLITAHFAYGKKLSWQNVTGIVSGLLGTFILFYEDLINSTINLKGDFLVFLSVIMWIVYSFAYQKIMKKYPASNITFIVFILGSLFLVPSVILNISDFSALRINSSSLISLLFLSVVCSFIAYYLWNLSINGIGIKITSNLILFIPIVSITAGILVFGESFNINLIFSTILILLGAYLASFSRKNNSF
ncbi:MAG: DMT family transporter [Candidatus Cloacimonetes bacterium]|nr:DMT family transporter [Candidatus Cloacimonadota bacterium]